MGAYVRNCCTSIEKEDTNAMRQGTTWNTYLPRSECTKWSTCSNQVCVSTLTVLSNHFDHSILRFWFSNVNKNWTEQHQHQNHDTDKKPEIQNYSNRKSAPEKEKIANTLFQLTVVREKWQISTTTKSVENQWFWQIFMVNKKLLIKCRTCICT